MSCRPGRSGFTLVELLVTIAVIGVLLLPITRVFKMVGGTINDNRLMIETIDRLRAASDLLQGDLQGHTVHTLPWRFPEANEGYLVYYEGPARDLFPERASEISSDENLMQWVTGAGGGRTMILGDVDDVLALTTKSRNLPFVGRYGNDQRESQVAEVVWFVRRAPFDSVIRPLILYRRVLLVRPDLDLSAAPQGPAFFHQYDISAHWDRERGRWVANTLADLTKPENRFAHLMRSPDGAATSVGQLDVNTESEWLRPFNEESGRLGDDVVLSDCVGFDIRAFDPKARLGASDSQSAGPYHGEYVDLNYAGSRNTSDFSGPPGPISGGTATTAKSVVGLGRAAGLYDTWSFHYENDGRDTDGDGVDDQGTDRIDNDGENGVDDAGERETAPPYPYPLRGLQVQIRAYEPGSRQVRQHTVVQDFLPQ